MVVEVGARGEDAQLRGDREAPPLARKSLPQSGRIADIHGAGPAVVVVPLEEFVGIRILDQVGLAIVPTVGVAVDVGVAIAILVQIGRAVHVTDVGIQEALLGKTAPKDKPPYECLGFTSVR